MSNSQDLKNLLVTFKIIEDHWRWESYDALVIVKTLINLINYKFNIFQDFKLLNYINLHLLFLMIQ